MSCQAITPTTNRSTRYFYSTGNIDTDMGFAEHEAMFAMAEAAFREDTVTIERQQKMIDEHPGRRMVWIEADRGLGMFRNLLDKLKAAENGASLAAEQLAAE